MKKIINQILIPIVKIFKQMIINQNKLKGKQTRIPIKKPTGIPIKILKRKPIKILKRKPTRIPTRIPLKKPK